MLLTTCSWMHMPSTPSPRKIKNTTWNHCSYHY